jgi:alanine racemase
MTDKNKTFATIDLGNLAFNIGSIKDFLNPKTRLMAVVKSNAYGHGIAAVSKEAAKAGVDSFGVFEVSEAEILRKNRINLPILVFGPADPEEIKKAIKLDLTLTVFNLVFAKIISKTAQSLGKRARVHVKIDTGMRRLGVRAGEGIEFFQALKKLPRIDIEGV